MSIRKEAFAPGEIFHCYNRGVDKRDIFMDQQDYVYFLKMLRHFNTSEVVGKLRLLEEREPVDPPVTILSYCMLPNHYHLVLRCNEASTNLSKYMQRVGGGYTMYFNHKYERTGALFQGKFKAKYIDSDQYLRQILAYVTYNYLVHDITDNTLYRSSLNTKDDLVRGLASNFSKGGLHNNLQEVVAIIRDIRSSRQDLELK